MGSTRGSRAIDRIFLNVSRSVKETGTLEALETEEEGGPSSDHLVAYCRLEVPKISTFKWETYTYRYFNERARDDFKKWMVLHSWDEVLRAEGSNNKTDTYQATLTAAMDKFFPWKTTRKKSNNLPWITKKVLKEISDRKRLFWQEGGKRTAAWKEKKKETEELVKEMKKNYMNNQKEHILAKDANIIFFRHVKTFSRLEKPKQFDVRQVFDKKTDKEIRNLGGAGRLLCQGVQGIRPAGAWSDPLYRRLFIAGAPKI